MKDAIIVNTLATVRREEIKERNRKLGIAYASTALIYIEEAAEKGHVATAAYCPPRAKESFIEFLENEGYEVKSTHRVGLAPNHYMIVWENAIV